MGIGYANFSNNSSNIMSNSVPTSVTNNIGDVQLVSSSSAIVENDESLEAPLVENTVGLVENENVNQNNENLQNSETVQTSNSDNSNYFAELKMQRNEMFSKNIETYQKIVDSETISSEQKSIAVQEIEKINNLQNSMKTAEELIKLKGFEDVVILSSNEKISVIVRIAVLSDSQVAQIQNIVSKEFNTEISNITISNK